MKKSQLKEVIQNIVAQKLLEAKGKPAKYGYIIAGKDSNDPVLQLVGYGNAPSSSWKKDVLRRIEELKKKVEMDDWHNAEYIIKQNGVLHSIISMMDEIYTDPKLREALETDSAAAANPSTNVPKTSSERDRVELQKYQQKLDKVTTDIKSAESNIAKRMDGVNKANKKDEMRKQQLTKQQGPIIKKMDQLKKKISTYSPEQSQNEKI